MAPFKDKIDVRFFTREDDVSDDASIGKALGTDRFVTLKQTHGTNVAIVTEPLRRTIEADASATDTRDLTLAIRIADCQPIIVYAPKKNVIGVIHAGWKGVRDGIIPEFFKTLKNEWGIEPSETFVCAGPSLCLNCAEFTDPVTELPTVDPRFFRGRHVDLRGAADHQLEMLGVPASNRERSPVCTKCTNDTLWSYRGTDHDAVKAGFTNVLTIGLR